MNQAIAGVSPHELSETTVMTVWPSNAAYGAGRTLGSLMNIKSGFYIFTVGNVIALLSIPVALAIYFWRVLPYVGTRYCLTNRRVVVQRGIMGSEEKSVDLTAFDAIDVRVRPGQEWYHAGDLVFRSGEKEVFHLPGVSRPEAFRQVCLKAHTAHVSVRAARGLAAASA